MVLAAAPPLLPLSDPVYLFGTLLLLIGLSPVLAAYLRLPSLVILIGLGALLGTHGLGLLSRDAPLQLLEKIGLLYIMLLAGLQMDLSNLKRLGTRALVFGLLTFTIPFIVGASLAILLGYSWLTALLVGILFSPHTLVSYPIVVRLGIIQRESMSVAIGGTVVTSILTLTGLSIVQAVAGGGLGWWLWVKLLVLLPLLIGVAIWSLPKLGQIVLQVNSDTLSAQVIFVLIVLFGLASATLLLGVDAIVGAFIAGLALNSVVQPRRSLMQQVELIGNSLFIPCFLISVGVLCDPSSLISQPHNLGLAALIVIGAIASKGIAAWLTRIAFRYTTAETLTILGLTLSRAALVLVIALYGMKTMLPGTSVPLIDTGLFNAMIVYIVVTCLSGPVITDRFGQQVARAVKGERYQQEGQTEKNQELKDHP